MFKFARIGCVTNGLSLNVVGVVVLCLWAAVGFDEGSEVAVERVEQKTEE